MGWPEAVAVSVTTISIAAFFIGLVYFFTR